MTRRMRRPTDPADWEGWTTSPRPLMDDAPIDYVEIIGDHTHTGKRGQFVAGSTPDYVQILRLDDGEPMALIALDDGLRCYARKCNLRIVSMGRVYTHRAPVEGRAR